MGFPGIIPLAAAFGVGKKKGRGRSVGTAAGDPSALQARLAEQLFQETSGARAGVVDEINSFFDAGPFATPQFGSLKDTIEDQFARARDSVIASTPEGGALTSALTDLESGRASSLVDAMSDLTESGLSRAERVGFGTSESALGSLGEAGAIRAQIKAASESRRGAKSGALGSALGGYLGGK